MLKPPAHITVVIFPSTCPEVYGDQNKWKYKIISMLWTHLTADGCNPIHLMPKLKHTIVQPNPSRISNHYLNHQLARLSFPSHKK